MLDSKIERINVLAQKARETQLSEEEKIEQITLRQEYIAAFRKSLTDTLENTYIVDPQGNKTKVKQTGPIKSKKVNK